VHRDSRGARRRRRHWIRRMGLNRSWEYPRDEGTVVNSEGAWAAHLKVIQRTNQQWNRARSMSRSGSRPFGATVAGSRFAMIPPSPSQGSLLSPRSASRASLMSAGSLGPLSPQPSFGGVPPTASTVSFNRPFGSTHSQSPLDASLSPSRPSMISLSIRRPKAEMVRVPSGDFSVLNRPRGIYPARVGSGLSRPSTRGLY